MPERVFPWLSLASGLLVLGMGALPAAGASAGPGAPCPRARPRPRPRPRAPGGGAQPQPRTGEPYPRRAGRRWRPVTWRSLLALGISGGLLPCPSALVVMLGAIALQRVLLGLVLIVAFSAGLAATLSAIGLAMVYSGRLAGRLATRLRLDQRRGRGAVGHRVAPGAGIPALSAGWWPWPAWPSPRRRRALDLLAGP